MNKLKLEHLAPYLPYELDVTFDGDEYTHRVVGLNITERGVELISPFEHWGTARIEDCMPILRPLSDLTKEINHNGDKFVPIDKINSYGEWKGLIPDETYGICDRTVEDDLTISGGGSWEGGIEEDIDTFQFYKLYVELMKWHFDIFGLIDKGLAIDINSLKGGSR